MTDAGDSFDVVVIGAGPGGIAAAVTAAEAGRRVCVVDDSPTPGGQIWRHRDGDSAPSGGRRWVDRLNAAKSMTRLSGSRVIARPGPNTLLVETVDRPRHITWQTLVLATGARELFLPFPGWTLPGVFGAGAIQALVKFGLPVKGKRVVVAGTGPLLLAVADLLRAKGAVVPLILEQASAASVYGFGAALVKSPAKLIAGAWMRGRLFKTMYQTGGYPLAVARNGSTLSLTYKARGGTALVDCDHVACGFGLIPSNELPLLLGCEADDNGFVRVDERSQTSIGGVFAVGEVTGIGGVDKAIIEGRLAGHMAAGELAAAAALARPQRSALAFTRRLARAFALRPELFTLARPDTVVCRCEDVTLAAISTALTVRDAKLQTRCGMGPCQGRICGPMMQKLCGVEAPQIRPPVFSTTVGTLAAVAADEKHG